MKLHEDSHVDHDISTAQLSYVLERFGDHNKFFIATVDLPPELGTVPCDLMGPLVGDDPVPESEVTYEARGDRNWKSRTIEVSSPRMTRKITVIAGPHDGEPCVLFTVYGGPLAPQESGDPGCEDPEASNEFWSKHALVKVKTPNARPYPPSAELHCDKHGYFDGRVMCGGCATAELNTAQS